MQQEIKQLLQLPSIQKFQNIFSNEIKNFYIVGGAVRSALLKSEIKDIDFATKYTPDDLMDLCSSKGVRCIATGIKYGTVTIILDKTIYEITSLREDIKTDGRHAIVTYSTDLMLDSKRRDFTINALYLDFNGKIYDFHNGFTDLNNREIKFIGDSKNRIQEDYLRILRFFRFYSELDGFTLKKESFTAVIEAKECIAYLSPERIKQEFVRILSGQNYCNTIKLLVRHQICNSIINLTDKLVVATEKYQNNNKKDNPQYEILIAFAILQYDNPIQELLRLKKHLALSNQEVSAIKAIITNYRKLQNLLLTPLEIKKLLIKYSRQELLLLYQYKIFITATKAVNYSSIIFQIKNLDIPKFPITGQDLLDNGVKEGKSLGIKLKFLKQKWIDSNFSINKQELLSLDTPSLYKKQ